MNFIFHNGRVVTVECDKDSATAVAVKGNKIFAVGSDEEILALGNDGTKLIDLGGRPLLPGFNDSHLHLIGYALNAAKVDLRQCRSIEHVVGEIQNFIIEREIEKGQWVLGWGWNQSLFKEGRMPNRHDLDRAAPDNPLMIMRTCCHISSVNSIALKQAGIYSNPPIFDGGTVEIGVDGVSTGVLKEKAISLVMDLTPSADTDMLKDLIKSAARDFLAAGLTSVQTDDLAALGSKKLPELIQAYRELETSGSLGLRINLQPLLMTIDELQSFLELGCRTGQGSDFFKIGPLKLLTDGSIGGRTALLSFPYAESTVNFGIAVLSRDELKKLVELAHKNGMQIAAHAIGDAAIDMVLDIYEDVSRQYLPSDPRFRIIHASVVRQDQLERFRIQGVIADIQPSFISSDFGLVDLHLGKERASWTYRWKDFAKYNIKMAGGSDCPVENYKPLHGIYAATTRQDKQGYPPGGWFPEQKLDLDEALHMYTMGSAYCSFEEDIKGSIKAGKLADMVVLSGNISATEPEMIKNIRVDLTMVDGKIVYRR